MSAKTLAFLGFSLFAQRIPSGYSGQYRANRFRPCSRFCGGAGSFVLPFFSSVVPGMIGSICVGVDQPCSMGCVPIGPGLSAGRFFGGMIVNAQALFWFE